MKTPILLIAFTFLLFACNQGNQEQTNNYPDKLVGVEIMYTYSEGNEYAVKLEEDGLSYQYRSGKSPEKWWGTFEYNHLITENGEHLLSWFEPGYGDYVTLLINFDNNILYGSAIIARKKIHFQKATITKVNY